MDKSKDDEYSISQGPDPASEPAVGATDPDLAPPLQDGDLTQNGIPQTPVLASNTETEVGGPRTTNNLQPGESTQSSPLEGDRTGVALDTSIGSLKAIKEAAESIPQFGDPIKATCGIMVLVLETVKKCKDGRNEWRDFAEVMQEKNQSIISLLDLYREAPQDYERILEQANRYQKILDEIASDMKQETETPSESGSGLESYWEDMKFGGKEAVLSKINTQQIAGYKERLLDQALGTTEVAGILVLDKISQVNKQPVEADEKKPLLPHKVNLKSCPPVVKEFIGRNDILERMRRTHFENTNPQQDTPRVTVLTGLGGSGKTQIAVKFASEFKDRFKDEPVYFLNASSKVTLEADLHALDRSHPDKHTDALVWLANTPRNWLIIMDNANDPSLKLAPFLPRCSHGHVIITSRNRSHFTLSLESTHHIDSLPLNEATTLLLNVSKYEDNGVNRQLSMNIAEELGCLPLAIAHAGAYIFRQQCLDTYLATYRTNPLQLLRQKVDMPQDYPYSVAATVEMSFEKLSLRARDFLGLLSHLDARSISFTVIGMAAIRQFRHVAIDSGLPLRTNTIQYADALEDILFPQRGWITLEFYDLIEECENFSLLQSVIRDGERFHSMHILVQTFLQITCGEIRGFPSRRLVARLLSSAITIGAEWECLAFNRLLSAHLRLVKLDDMTEAGDHFGFGFVLRELGEGRLAVNHLERCMEIWKDSLSQDSTCILRAMEALGWSYSIVGEKNNALTCRETVVKRRREVLGDDHRSTLLAMNNLAASYLELGRNEEALRLQEEVLEKQRKLLGDDHHYTLMAMNNLALSYSKLGRNEEALRLQEEALEKQRRLLGDDHLETVAAVHNLALLYEGLGRNREVLQLREEVLEKRRRLLGDNHPDTLVAMTNLAVSYSGQGRKEEALQLQEEALEKQRRLLGGDHQDTVLSMSNLTTLYSELGRKEEALKLRVEVLEKRRQLLGGDHLDTLVAMINLAISYLDLGRNKEALKLQEEVLEKQRRLLGDDHQSTLATMTSLATSYSDLGRNKKASQLEEEILEKRRRLLGGDHLDTVTAMNNLAFSYAELGRDEDALKLEEEVFEKWKRLLGGDHPDTLMVMSNLVILYSDFGRYEEVARLQEELLEKQKTLLGNDHPDTLRELNVLAYSYLKIGRANEALPLSECAVKDTTKCLGEDHFDTLNAMDTLAQIYVALGRFEEALPLAECAANKMPTCIGDSMSHTLEAMDTLSKVYAGLGRHEDASNLETAISSKRSESQKK
ncbi:TPR-like protein [Serendipita vermifera]|nr:TPR-like protein [Serendipita vermifera]